MSYKFIFYIALIMCTLSTLGSGRTMLLASGVSHPGEITVEDLGLADSSESDGAGFTHCAFVEDVVWYSVVATTAPPVLELEVTALDFGETETSQTFTITNSGGSMLVWSLNASEEWITATPAAGSIEATASTTVTVEVDRSQLVTVGVHEGTVIVSSNGGSTEIEITVTVPDQPVLEVSPSALDFGSEYVVKELLITNSGTGTLEWEITAQESWITIDHATGTTDEGEAEVVNVLVDRSAVTELGTYSDELSITSDGGDTSVSVVMERVNHTPEVPTIISPADGAVEQSLYTTLKWQGGDADEKDGDIVKYDVYFSSNASLVDIEDVSVLVCSNREICYCDPGTSSLENAITYYWKVVAEDSYDVMTSSSIWSFTTENDHTTLCPTFALELGYRERQLLREFRDTILARDESGRYYIGLYYRYAWELLLILFFDEELRSKSIEIVSELFPVIQNLLIHQEAWITAESLGEIRELLLRIALRSHPQLRTVLEAIRKDLGTREKLERFGVVVDD